MRRKFCCRLFESFATQDKSAGYKTNVEVGYADILREHYIGKNETRQSIFRCPWCGAKFPVSLRTEYETAIGTLCKMDADGVVEALYNKNADGSLTVKTDAEIVESNPHLPRQFKTGEWWRRRKIPDDPRLCDAEDEERE